MLSGAKACKSCRSRQELSIFFSNQIAVQTSTSTKYYLVNSIYLQNSASIQPRTSLSKFGKNWPTVRIEVRKNTGAAP